MKLGIQQPRFNFGVPAGEIYSRYRAQVDEADQAGYDTFFVMDHLCQVPAFGPPGDPVLEAYALLAALASESRAIELGCLVTGNPYRNPALLAKMISTIDVISGGRAVLGLGAGWMELEHRMYGYRYQPVGSRITMLEQSLEIITAMLRDGRSNSQETWSRTAGAVNEPRLRDNLPVLVGGAGERRVFSLAARYADRLNIECAFADLPRKLRAIGQRCAEVNRDRRTLEVSVVVDVIMADSRAEADRTLRAMYAPDGPLSGLAVTWDDLNQAERDRLTGTMVIGSAEEIAQQLSDCVLQPGLDGVVVKMLPNAHEPGVIAEVAAIVGPLVKAA
jgi:alkanesulfonate monooxygenase SsuD/methylene tetrahydromethanopterin reductase-like flavin-dependent oxidoreductase (luciferase family)